MILEVGCGHGCSILPLFDAFPNIHFYLTDYSINALVTVCHNMSLLVPNLDNTTSTTTNDITFNNTTTTATPITTPPTTTTTTTSTTTTTTIMPSKSIIKPVYTSRIISCLQWDFTVPFSYSKPIYTTSTLSFEPIVHAVLCIFVLSAIPPEKHVTALIQLSRLLSHDGVILFRDYGIYDMTMYRHKIRYDTLLFERNHTNTPLPHLGSPLVPSPPIQRVQRAPDDANGTLVYYFDLEYITQIVTQAGLVIVELEYATVNTYNRKLQYKNNKSPVEGMKRVFVHGVFKKI